MNHTWAWAAIILGLALPAGSAQRITVAQLDRVLTESQTLPDGELAAKLSELRLTERFSSERLAHWRTALTGAKSERALLGLADRSAFLEPPEADIPGTAAPDIAEERRILGLAATYVSKAIR